MSKAADVSSIGGDGGVELHAVLLAFNTDQVPVFGTISSRTVWRHAGFLTQLGVNVYINITHKGKVQICLIDPPHSKKAVRSQILSGAHFIHAGTRLIALGTAVAIGAPMEVCRPPDGMADVLADRAFCAGMLKVLLDGHQCIDTFGTFIFVFLFGEAYDALKSARFSDVERVSRLHAAQLFINAITAHADQTMPNEWASPDHKIAALTLNNLNWMLGPSNSLDVCWSESYPGLRRFVYAEGSHQAEHPFGRVEQQVATRSILDHVNQWKRNLAVSTLKSRGDIAAIKSRHGYQQVFDELLQSPMPSESHTLYTCTL